jgi:integrase
VTYLLKGELFGLRKTDVDLQRRLLMVRRSYDHGSTKGGRARAVPICAALVPFLEAAIESFPGELLFPKPTGKMRTEHDALGRRMRRAMSRAGIVTGYVHSCRRCKARGTPHVERHADNVERTCPACGMRLWAKGEPKKLRLHDTRHTTATLLLSLGADIWGVSKILGHADASITSRVYGYVVPGYLAAQAERLSGLFETPTGATLTVGQGAAVGALAIRSVPPVACPQEGGFELPSSLLSPLANPPSEGFGAPVVQSSPAPKIEGRTRLETPADTALELERNTGFGPATFALARRRSTS